ncbi:MAG: response regulator [Zoogloeaceae bacterium]|jgi:two-component system nitrate/nitrite response regulator NarL|nr:response regulator [Zoogloeaceae bacterium]
MTQWMRKAEQESAQPEFPLRLLLIDDHPLFRRGLVELFDEHAEFVVVGEASGGREGINLASRLAPHIVLLDLHMPGLSGLQVLDELRQLELDCRIVILTGTLARAELLAALRLGVDGYLTKDVEPEILLESLRRCLKGVPQLDQAAIALLARPEGPAHSADLTEREAQTLALIANGLSNKRIARELGISDGTVKIYVKNLLRKFNLKSRLELAVWTHRDSGGP